MTNSITIEHNPFKVETKFLINGKQPEPNPLFASCEHTRLQVWIEDFFQKVDKEIFNEYGKYDVSFKGLESDYLDVAAAVQVAAEHNIKVNLTWARSEDAIHRLNKLEHLMDKAEHHPIFGGAIKNNENIKKGLREALNKDFDVYVAATMSAGKSTLINAMLGCDLLPTANEATTATIATIHDDKSKKTGEFTGKRLDKQGNTLDDEQSVNIETLTKWNKDENTSLIKLNGNIVGITPRDDVRLVITDTPGPNNSQDSEHQRITMQHIGDSSRNPLILYILNGRQLGTGDDQRTLASIAETMKKGGKQAKDRFIFIANQMDAFNPEKEPIDKVLERIRKYLSDNDIKNPLVYPVSAQLTYLLRAKENQLSLTDDEYDSLELLEKKFTRNEARNLIQYMPLTKSARDNLANRSNLSEVEKRSGIPAVEAMIDEYIDKYNIPERVYRGYEALSTAIKNVSDEQDLIKSLETETANLDKIKEQLEKLSDSKNLKIEAKTKIDETIGDKSSLYPKKQVHELKAIMQEIQKSLREEGNSFEGLVNVRDAEIKLKELEMSVRFKTNTAINKAEEIVNKAQTQTQQELLKIFNQFVNSLFQNIELPTVTLESLKSTMSNFAHANDIGMIKNDEITITHRTVREATGTREVSRSTWYKPWTWGKTEWVTEYTDKKIAEKKVNLNEVWKTRDDKIRQYFNDLARAATEKIEEDTDIYIGQFIEFVTEEFTQQTQKVTQDLAEKMQSQEKLEAAIVVAKDKLAQINAFKAELEAVVAL